MAITFEEVTQTVINLLQENAQLKQKVEELIKKLEESNVSPKQ